MIYGTDRILTTHAGSLPRPDDLREMVLAKARSEPYDRAALDRRLEAAVKDIVRQQIECGLDIVNDGELSKPNFTDYVSSGLRDARAGPGQASGGSA
jgi:5-methyltetrahydropteroyltriglutamate--homocysteine methyltransferase